MLRRAYVRNRVCPRVELILKIIIIFLGFIKGKPNNKCEKYIVPCTPHSAIARRVSATPPSWVGSAVSNSVVYLAAERIQRLEINNMRASLVWFFFAYKQILGRTETRIRDRMYLGRIRSVWDISRGDRARIATCSLRTPTDRLKANYSVDCRSHHYCLYCSRSQPLS